MYFIRTPKSRGPLLAADADAGRAARETSVTAAAYQITNNLGHCKAVAGTAFAVVNRRMHEPEKGESPDHPSQHGTCIRSHASGHVRTIRRNFLTGVQS